MRDEIYNTIAHGKTLGKEFEDDMIPILKSRIKRIEDFTNGSEQKRKENDIYKGTDIIYSNEIRIDLTTNFSNKDNMPFIYETNIPGYAGNNFKIGIRHGNTHNGYHEFEEPTVVIGLDINKADYCVYDYEIMDNMAKHADDLMYAASDAYYTYLSNTQSERECVEPVKFEQNRHYTKPKKIGSRYDQLNQFTEQIIKNGEPEWESDTEPIWK